MVCCLLTGKIIGQANGILISQTAHTADNAIINIHKYHARRGNHTFQADNSDFNLQCFVKMFSEKLTFS